ncbi:MAG TPA: PEP-CTERM sorting domain-containing protein [Pseudomonadales bacterium]|nr:PEP-CTERM sorting domain-containing protein [Pseudomonadales bacterium]
MKTRNAITYRSLGGAAFAGAVLFTISSAQAQNLFVSSFATGHVYEYTPGGVQSTFASGLNYPDGVAFNANGDLFVGNTALNAGDTGSITEFSRAGTQTTFYNGVDAVGLAFDNAGDLFEADYSSGNIYKYTPAGVQSLFASGFNIPTALAFNSAGDLFVGGGGGNNGYISELLPNGTAGSFSVTGLNFPAGLAFNSAGTLFQTDNGSGRIYEYTPGGTQSIFVTGLSAPNGMAFDGSGNLFVGESYSNGTDGRIVEITPGGTVNPFATGIVEPDGLAFQPVPEPSVLGLMVAGAAGFLAWRRKQ